MNSLESQLSAQALPAHSSGLQLLETINQHALVSITDPAGTITYANELFCQVSGYTQEELVGQNHRLIKSGKHSESFYKDLWSTIRSGQTWQGEICNRRKDGSLYWVTSTIKPFLDHNGQIYRFISIRTEITPQKILTDKLQQNERFLSSVVESQINGVVVVNLKGEITLANHAAAEILELKRNEVTGHYYQEADYWKQIDLDGNLLPMEALPLSQAMIERKAVVGFEHGIIFPDGNLKWISVSASPILGAGTELIGAVASFLDITEKQNLDRALKEKAQRHESILQAARDGFLLTDTNGNILETNPAFCRMIGYTTQELTRMTLHDIDADESPEETQGRIQALMASGGATFEVRHRRKDGRLLNIEVSTRYQDIDGGRFVAFLRDITDRKENEAVLRAAMEAATTANRAKSEFLATMSHEIRTPLHAILGLAELLEDTSIDADQRRMVHVIRKSGDGLLGLLNDILDLASVEKGKLSIEKRSFNLMDMLDELIELFSIEATQQGTGFLLNYETSAPRFIYSDAVRIRQILLNLIGNAVKFTRDGHITIDVRATPDELLIEIKDTGVGIAPEKQALIFEEFSQGDSSIQRKFGGTGLGLTISSRLVELLRGKIECQSTVGEGSSFRLFLPLEQEPTASTANPEGTPEKRVEPRSSQLADLRILLADDNPLGQMVVQAMLNAIGCSSDLAANGREVLQLTDQNEYDLILMDCEMPEMDGLEATRRIRENEAAQKAGGHRTTILALTAHAMKEIEEQCFEVGMDGVLTKPLSKEELRQALTAHIQTP